MHAFDWLNEPLTGKSLLKLEAAYKRRCSSAEQNAKTLRSEMKRVEILRSRQADEVSWMLKQITDHCEEELKLRLLEADAAEIKVGELRSELEAYKQSQAQDADSRRVSYNERELEDLAKARENKQMLKRAS